MSRSPFDNTKKAEKKDGSAVSVALVSTSLNKIVSGPQGPQGEKGDTGPAGGLLGAASIAELRSLIGQPGDTRSLRGYAAVDDGGGGLFVWDPSSGTDNGGTLLNSTGYGTTKTGLWRRVYSGPIDVRWFGALLDGSDDSSAVQKAINTANHGSIILIPEGTCNLKVNVSNKKNITIRGFGRGTILTHSPDPAGVAWNDGIITFENNSTGCIVENLQIQGAAIFSTATLQCGIVIQTAADKCSIKNVLFAGTDSSHGLNACVILNSVNDCEIFSCEISHVQGHDGTDGVGYGFLIAGDRNKIHNNRSVFPSGQGRHHIYCGPGAKNEIHDNHIDGGWYEQIIVRATGAQDSADYNIVYANRLLNAGSANSTYNDLTGAISVGQKANGNSVVNNTIVSPKMHGILITDYDTVGGESPTNNSVSGNHVFSSYLTGVQSHGATSTLMISNDIHDAGQQHVVDSGATDWNALQVLNSTYVSAPTGCKILNNVIGYTGSPEYYDAVVVGGGVTGCEVSGNTALAGYVSTYLDVGTNTLLGFNSWNGVQNLKPIGADSISELRSIIGLPGDSRSLRGFNSINDGGGGLFVWSTTTATDDGGTVLNIGGLGSSSAGWRRVYSGALDARWFGAVADGISNARAAIQAAIDAQAALGGGEVFLPIGTYITTDYLNIPTGVTIRGAGRGATIINLVVSSNAYGINIGPDITDWGIKGLTLKISATGATTQTTGVNASGNVGHPCKRGTVDDLEIESATFAGLFTEFCEGLQIGSLYIRDQNTCSDGLGGRLGGPAIWFFKGTKNVTVATVLVDTTSDGVFCDTGTQTGGGVDTTDIVIGVLNVIAWGRDSNSTGSAFGVQGAKRITIGALSAHGDGNTLANIVNGITIEQDQNAIVAQDIHIGSATLSNFGGYPVIFRGAQRCSIGPLKIKDGLQAILSFGVGYAIRFEPPNYLLNGSTAADTVDNTIGPVDVEIANTTNSRYDYGVLFQGANVTLPDTSTTPSSALRNRILGGRWGTGASSTLTPSAVYNVSASGGGSAPVTGVNANLIDGRDIDNRTPLIQGMPLKIDVPGVGRLKIGPQNSTYCHFETDRDNFYFTKEGSATATFFFNGPTVTAPGSAPAHGMATITIVADSDRTLNSGEYYAEIIKVQGIGVLSTGRNIILPLTTSATWDVLNLTDQTLTFKGATGSGVAVTAGSRAHIFTDGINFY